ncbi:hypothetical protein ASZ90_005056 [hydrocarbon metagenome]|uniref:Bacteriocin-protection protein n=1 Tax=hydrocarbon metagenome TaxID=938273 RepID=A0A0W8FW39_9ZZZZ
MHPKFFKTQKDLRSWFEKNHKKIDEMWIGYYKKATGKQSITWSESVDEAICFGWIDGIRKSINDESYMIRFTPRKPKSNWSAVNIEKVKNLTKLGLMKPEGIEAYGRRQEHKSKIYSYEQKVVQLDKSLEGKFKKNKKAWQFFTKKLAPSYRKISIRWVMSAKQEKTRLKRLDILIASSAKGEKIPLLVK